MSPASVAPPVWAARTAPVWRRSWKRRSGRQQCRGRGRTPGRGLRVPGDRCCGRGTASRPCRARRVLGGVLGSGGAGAAVRRRRERRRRSSVPSRWFRRPRGRRRGAHERSRPWCRCRRGAARRARRTAGRTRRRAGHHAVSGWHRAHEGLELGKGGRLDLLGPLGGAGTSDVAGVGPDQLVADGLAEPGAQQAVGVAAQGRTVEGGGGVPLAHQVGGEVAQGHGPEGGEQLTVQQAAVVGPAAGLQGSGGEPSFGVGPRSSGPGGCGRTRWETRRRGRCRLALWPARSRRRPWCRRWCAPCGSARRGRRSEPGSDPRAAAGCCRTVPVSPCCSPETSRAGTPCG